MNNECTKCNGNPCDKKSKAFPSAVIEIDNPPVITNIRKVVIPASMGDDTVVPPAVGKYHNVLLYYEANQKSYLYSSDGIPTQLVNGVTDYEQAVNLPQINGVTLLGDKSAADLGLADAPMVITVANGNTNWSGADTAEDVYNFFLNKGKVNIIFNGEGNYSYEIVSAAYVPGEEKMMCTLAVATIVSGEPTEFEGNALFGTMTLYTADKAIDVSQIELQPKLFVTDFTGLDLNYNELSGVPATNASIGMVKSGNGLEVASDGTLSISDIEQYAHFFDTVADMKAATNLKAGDYAKTDGFHTLNDGGGALYKITDTGTANEMNVIAIGNLYANFIVPTFVKPEMIGAYGDGTHDDTDVLQYLLTTYDNIEIDKSHLVTDTISATSNKVIKGNGTLILGGANFDLLYISGDNCLIDGLSFTNPDNYKPSDISIMPLGRAIWCVGNNNTVTNCKIDNYISGIIFGNNGAGKSQCKAIGNKITNLNGLSTGWVNDGIMSFSAHCIIENNYVDIKTGTDYARAGICCDIDANYCIIKNNYVNGNDNVTADIHVERSTHCQILNNYCIQPAQQGICISHYNKAIGNYVETGNTTRTGYTLNLSGILATSVNNTEIKDNTIIGRYSGGYGIYCSTNDYGIIARNKICGDSNKLERGINCLNSTRLIIEENIIQNQLVNFYGISVSGVSSSGTRIINNIIGTCYSQASSGTRSGIVFANISDFIISNNYIDNYVRGIHCNGNSRGVIANNQIVNTTDTSVINTGILCTTSNDTELIYVSDNYVQDFTYREIDKGSNSNSVYVTNKNKKDFYDNTAGAIKTLSINNSNVVVS